MFEEPPQGAISVEAQNAPNLSYTSTPILGNMDFTIQAPQSKYSPVQEGFPQVSYVSVEAEIYFANIANGTTTPSTILSGNQNGQSALSGQVIQSDATNTARYSQGTQLST